MTWALGVRGDEEADIALIIGNRDEVRIQITVGMSARGLFKSNGKLSKRDLGVAIKSNIAMQSK